MSRDIGEPWPTQWRPRHDEDERVVTPPPLRAGLIMALPNGRILGEVMPLLRRIGIEPEPAFDDPASRQLRFRTSEPGLDLIRVRSFDAATFVAFGAAQLGIAGNDVLMEFDYSEIYAPLDLDVGHCRLAVAATADWARAGRCAAFEPYSRRDEISGNHAPPFRGARHPGGVHQAQRRDRARAASWPLPPHRRSGADRRDARANGLIEIEPIAEVSSRLIVNRPALKTRPEEVGGWIERFRAAVGGGPSPTKPSGLGPPLPQCGRGRRAPSPLSRTAEG